MDRRSLAAFPWEPDPGVCHRKPQRAIALIDRVHLNLQSHFALVCKFDGVPDEVDDDLAQSAGISSHNVRKLALS